MSQTFPFVTAKFPVFSLSGKSKSQIPSFPCAMATLYSLTFRTWQGNHKLDAWFPMLLFTLVIKKYFVVTNGCGRANCLLSVWQCERNLLKIVIYVHLWWLKFNGKSCFFSKFQIISKVLQKFRSTYSFILVIILGPGVCERTEKVRSESGVDRHCRYIYPLKLFFQPSWKSNFETTDCVWNISVSKE